MRKLHTLRSDLVVLLVAAGLALGADPSGCVAPTTSTPAPDPEPVLGLSANDAASIELLQGWPLVLDLELLHPDAFDAAADAQPIVVAAAPTSWAQAVTIEVATDTGDEVAWPFTSPAPPAGDLRLDSTTQGTLLSWLSPTDTALLDTGDYVLTARLDTRSATAPGAFVGRVQSVPVHVHVVAHPGSLSAPQEIRELELLARYHELLGEPAQARVAAEDLSLLHPESPRGFALLGDLDAAAGDLTQALVDIQQAYAAFRAANPDSQEPPTSLLVRRRALRSALLRNAIGLGSPRLSARVTGQGPGPTQDVVYLDLLLSNSGSTVAVESRLESVHPRVLTGSGSVELESSLSPELPLQLPWLDPGEATTVRLYFTAPASVQRFVVAEQGTTQGELGGDFHFSLSQAVMR